MTPAVPFLVAAVLGVVPGQEPAPPKPSAETARAAAELLKAHAERCRGTAVLVADYVQRRTTQLAKEPLVSSGRFVFVREPGCVVFRATEPRESVTRLRADTYEVHRPQKKQLERFVLDGPELAASLFAALGGDVDTLQRDFEVRAAGPDPDRKELVAVVLEPRRPEVRARLTELRLTFAAKDRALAAVAYRDAAGDLVEIELRNPVVNPAPPPSIEFELAPDTAVIEHGPEKRR